PSSKWTVSKEGFHTCRREYLTPLAKAKILANVRKTGYSQGTITNWDFYRIAKDSILYQRVEESEDFKEEEEEDPTEIEPMQSVEIPNNTEPMEVVTEPNMTTSMFRTQLRRPNFRHELSKLMDIM
ncbi:hypothetical protein J1N35_013962, partial [Gossypium stocksii]